MIRLSPPSSSLIGVSGLIHPPEKKAVFSHESMHEVSRSYKRQQVLKHMPQVYLVRVAETLSIGAMTRSSTSHEKIE